MSSELVLYLQLFVILLIDMICGDPRTLPHPIRFIGFLCTRFEALTRSRFCFLTPLLQGIFTFFFVIGSALLSLWLIIWFLGTISIYAAVAGACITCYFCTAAGDLVKHSSNVYTHLEGGDIDKARLSVAMMVGRDTDNLDEAEISRACIESVSENLVDGITAPLFWGLVAALVAPYIGVNLIICASFGFVAYKAVNTMDSMFGYKNENYMDFGSCAARVDDICNFVPARLSGLCVMVVALFPVYDAGRARHVFLADRLKSSSPNSAHTEAAVAGALGIRLGGTSSYFGEPTQKPYLGEGQRTVRSDDINRANRLVLLSAVLFFLVAFALHWIITQIYL